MVDKEKQYDSLIVFMNSVWWAGALLLTDIRIQVSNLIRGFNWDAMYHPCPDFNGGLINLP